MVSDKIGPRIRQLREENGLSRVEVALGLGVDPSAVAAWETGRYMPRSDRRAGLAALLKTPLGKIFAESDAFQGGDMVSASLIDTLRDIEPLLSSLLASARRSLKALRISAPYSTPAHVQMDFRKQISKRILDGSIEVQRVEIFYSLDRLKEVFSNILRYDGRRYWVKCYCAGLKEVVPGMGGYFFDDEHFLVGAYWTGIPPHDRPGLHLSGEPFRTYFREYWSEIWGRGTLLNNRGAHDLGAVRDVALALGLAADGWDRFVVEARELNVGDGCPPLI
jgi:transcriptional regulator with XRE-family HTH domain